MNTDLIADKVEGLAREIEILRSEVLHSLGEQSSSTAEQQEVTNGSDLLSLVQGLHIRMNNVEQSLTDIRDDVSISARIDPTSKLAMRKLADFFQEIGGQFSIESLEIILRQAVSNFCKSDGGADDTAIVDEHLEGALVLDARGLNCPMPTLRTIKEIEKLTSGEILHVKGTDPTCRNGLKSWCARAGHQFLGERDSPGFHSFFIRKG